MTLKLATAARNAAANAVVGLLDAGSGAATIKIYSGTQPTAADDAASGSLLATFTMADPAFGSASSGAAAADCTPVLTTTGGAAGAAGYARFADSTGATVFDCSVTATGGGGDITLNTTTISVGLGLELTAITYTQPA